MKNTLLIFPVCFFILSAYGQTPMKLEFSINGSEFSLKRNNELITSPTAEIKLSRGQSTEISVINPNSKSFTFKIEPVGGQPKSFTQSDFNNERKLIIDSSLSLGALILKDGFKIIILGSDPLFKKSFTWKLDTNVKNQKDAVFEGKKEYKPGSIIYDAMALNQPNQAEPAAIQSIIKYYFPQWNGEADSAMRMIKKNSFLYSLDTTALKRIIIEAIDKRGPQGFGGVDASSLSLSSLGGLDVTTLVDGFAKFLVDRTKQELNIAFFTKFKGYLEQKQFRDLQTIFPQTYRALKLIDDEIYNYNQYLQTLRECFEKDLSNLLTNLPTIVENHETYFDKHYEYALMLINGCYIATSLQDNEHPGEILANYSLDHLDKIKDENWRINLKGGIQTLQLFSESLRDTTLEESRYWVTTKQVRELVNNKDLFRIYFGLLNERVKLQPYNNGVNFKTSSGTLTLSGLFAQLAPPDFDKYYDSYKIFISELGANVNRLNTLIEMNQRTTNDSIRLEQYYNFFSASIDLFEQTTKIFELPIISTIQVKLNLNPYFDVSRSAADLTLDINRRNYASAVINAAHIYDVVINSRINTEIEALGDVVSSKERVRIEEKLKKTLGEMDYDILRNNQFDTSAINFPMSVDEKNQSYQIRKRIVSDSILSVPGSFELLFKYGSFMATVVQAENSDEVKQAIETFALPVGSSRIKRETAFNVSLNSYVGPYGGGEWTAGMKCAPTVGLSAPIGVGLNWGIPPANEGRGGKSVSLYFSAIDLGAPTAYRFTSSNDTVNVETIPTIKLEDIVAPGAFVSFGFGKCPVSLNLGAQYGPLLRKVAAEENTLSNHYWRVIGSLCVDIPIINLYTKSRDPLKKKKT